MSKDQWFSEYERIGDDLAAGDITRGVAIERWLAIGLYREQAESEADAAQGKEP